MSETRVNGTAAIGDRVTYFDMANQDGKVWTVTGLPARNEEFGWMSGYTLTDAQGNETTSDLRQHGWTFASVDADGASAETITEYVARRGITVEILHDRGVQVEDGWEHHAYTLLLQCDGHGLETPWKQGPGIEESPVDRPDSVLDSLISDASMAFDYDTFEEFADSMGYDSDSRRAYATWEQIRNSTGTVAAFLGGVSEFAYVSENVERL